MKNILRILVFCSIVAPTQCMLPKIIKRGISAVGTTLGLGLPLGTRIYPTYKSMQDCIKSNTDPIAHIESITNAETREPSDTEKLFLQSCIQNDKIPFRIITQPKDIYQREVRAFSPAITNGNIIAVSEKLFSSNHTPSDALLSNRALPNL